MKKLFSTILYQTPLFHKTEFLAFRKTILREIDDIRENDMAGIDWSKVNYKNGFTSYASANDMHLRSATFANLEKKIDLHVAKYARKLGMKLQGTKLKMTTFWVNYMPANTHHGLHIHPLSVISGTFYIQVPKGASSIRFEDPRLDKFMNSPPRDNLTYEVMPREGSIVLFESWLRHEVPLNTAKSPRISVSFNYEWSDS